jgi:hypothetical protein
MVSFLLVTVVFVVVVSVLVAVFDTKHAPLRILGAVGGAIAGSVVGPWLGFLWLSFVGFTFKPANYELSRCIWSCTYGCMVLGTLVGSAPRQAERVDRCRGGRVIHCYRCKTGLDDSIHSTYGTCGWMECPACGACGCGYKW